MLVSTGHLLPVQLPVCSESLPKVGLREWGVFPAKLPRKAGLKWL